MRAGRGAGWVGGDRGCERGTARSAQSPRVLRWIRPGLLALVLAAGCGHNVTPKPDYSDPSSLPLPDNFRGVSSLSGVVLGWDHPDEVFEVIDGWNIYRATVDGVPADADYTLIEELYTLREYLDSSVENNRVYWYRLTSVSPASVESVPSAPVRVRVDFNAPAPPTDLTAVAGSSTVLLSWSPSPEPDLAQYNVYRDPVFSTFIFVQGSTSYLDRDVGPGVTYRYYVTAEDEGLNESAPSNVVTVTLPSP